MSRRPTSFSFPVTGRGLTPFFLVIEQLRRFTTTLIHCKHSVAGWLAGIVLTAPRIGCWIPLFSSLSSLRCVFGHCNLRRYRCYRSVDWLLNTAVSVFLAPDSCFHALVFVVIVVDLYHWTSLFPSILLLKWVAIIFVMVVIDIAFCHWTLSCLSLLPLECIAIIVVTAGRCRQRRIVHLTSADYRWKTSFSWVDLQKARPNSALNFSRSPPSSASLCTQLPPNSAISPK